MPDVYIEEVSRLVDEVPPVPFFELEPVIRPSLDPDVFVSIDPEPLAAASIAQIHKALLHDGREVVVKVRGVPASGDASHPDHPYAPRGNRGGFAIAAALGLYMLWKILRTSGSL